MYTYPAGMHAQTQDGDLAPRGLPDGELNIADFLIMQRIVSGDIEATPLDLLHGDLYPPGLGDGNINLSDQILLQQLILQTGAPLAIDDPAAAITPEDTPVTTGDVLANDTLIDNAAISAFDDTSANSVTPNIVNNGNGTFDYTPPTNFNGDDSFTYTITDDQGESSSALVTITVTAVNDIPAANADDFSVPEDGTLNGDVLADNGNGADNPGDEPSSVALGAINVGDGNLILNTDGTFTYTPNPDFNGIDAFSYSLTDSTPETAPEAIVTINVTPVNDIPVANADAFAVPANGILSGNVLADNGSGADQPGDTPTTVAPGTTSTSNGSLMLNTDGTFSYVPNTDFSGTDTFSYTLTDSTPEISNEALATITVIPDQSVFTAELPVQPDTTDGNSYELGMKFQAGTAGHIKAIRFYKSPSESGTHQGAIWTSTGTQLATVTFVNETASGWQEQLLDTPLNIQAGTTYVVSVNANQYFAATNGGLATPVSNGDLISVADGNNGVLGSPGTFPTSSFQDTNYFRDVIFFTGAIVTRASGDNQSAEISTTLPEPLVAEVRDANGLPLAGIPVDFLVTAGTGSVSTSSTTTDSNGKASTVLTLGSTAGINTVRATATNIGNVTFTANAYLPPTQLADLTPAIASTDITSPLSYQVTLQDQFGNLVTGATNPVTFAVTGIIGTFSPAATVSPVNGIASVSFAPSSTGSATITATSPGLTDTSGSMTVTDLRLFSSEVPATPDTTDGNSYELGMKFQSSAAGHIRAIRYFKSPSETGAHQGTIWSSTGTQLATVTFTDETASGWQEQALDTPLNILAGTTYVVSVNANQYFAASSGGLATSITNGSLSSVADGNNGVLGNPGTFPTSSFLDTNYFRDVTFTTGSVITRASGNNQGGETATALPDPLVVEIRDANGLPQTGIPVDFIVTGGGGSVSTSNAVTDSNGQASTALTLGIAAGTNTVSATANNIGSVTFTASAYLPPTQLADLTPASTSTDITSPVSYQVALQDQFGNTTANATNPVTFAVAGITGSFSPAATVTPVNGVASVSFTPASTGSATISATSPSLAGANGSLTVTDLQLFSTQIPAFPDSSDGLSYELGMKFQSSTAGHIRAIRFYKSPSETGTHQGTIWSSTGTQLATVAFVNETASGWQEQLLDTPLNILPGTTYVVSVNSNQYFATTSGGLATSISSGTLSSVADGNNGVFGNPGTFPASSFENSNYFRDVVFTTGTVITRASGDNQSGEVTTTLPNPMTVEIRDANGLPQANVPVNFLVTAGGGSVSTSSALTDGNGQASTVLTLGTAAGTNTVNATATIGSVTFTANAYLPATQLVLAPTSANTNISNSVNYLVTVQDQFGNTVTNSTAPVTFAVTGITGSFSPAATVTPVNGVASVSFTPTSTGSATISATSPSLAGANGSLTVTDLRLFTTQVPDTPNSSDGNSYELGMKFQSSTAGHILAVRYYKAPNETGVHQGSIWSATGVRLATATFINETASGWQEQLLDAPLIIQPGTTYVVSVNANQYFATTSGGLATTITNDVLSSVADGNNGVFGSLGTFPTSSFQDSNYFRDLVFYTGTVISKVSGDNQSGEIETVLPNPLVVEVRDANNLPQAGVPVDFLVTAGGGSVATSNTVTDSNGQASTTFTLGSVTDNAVTVTAMDIGSVTFSATATLPPEPPTQLSLAPASARTNIASPVVYHATVQDQFGNPVIDASNQVSFATTGISGTFAPGATVTPVGGIASVTFTPGSAGNGTITATSPGLTSSNASLTVTDLQISIVSGDNQTGLIGAALDNPLIVQIVDAQTGLNEAGVTTTFTPSPTTGTTLPQLAVTDSNGLASTRFILAPTTGSNTVTATTSDAGSVVFAATGTSSGNSITKVGGDNQTGNPGTQLGSPLVVEVRDSGNNPLVGVNVSFNLLDGTGSVSPLSAVTDSLGQASTTLTLGVESGIRTINAVAENIGGVTFNAESANPIVIENQKPGNPEYETVRSGYTETDIVGYADATSVSPGDVLSLKISMAVPGDYSIDVYRFGYYGGAGARQVLPTIGPLNGVTQPDCQVTEPQTRLIECQWSTSYSLPIGNDWTSGLYMARLWDETTTKQFPIFFTVRDDSSTADIVFQSSITTSLAYAAYGTPTEQYNLYTGTGGQRAYKVSFDRPSAELSQYSNLLRYEYNMIRWLESQGYDVTYVTNMDVHENPALLLQHKAFLSVGHDEYWSLEMRDAVEAARDAGVNLGLFSANSAYWRVRFEPSSTGQPNRVMVCYKDPLANDPVAPTYLWRGPENNRPENALFGVMYIGDHNPLYGGFDSVIQQSADPYFNNTGLADGDALTGLVGYEWDAVVDNGFTPPGLTILAESTVAPSTVAPGLPPGTDVTKSHAVKYTASSGAKVFSTGSIQWVWALDSDWVTTPREDPRVKQATINIFSDFGILPSTPDPGMIVP